MRTFQTVLEFMEYGDLRDVVISAKQKKLSLEVGEQLDMYAPWLPCPLVTMLPLEAG